MRTLVGGAEGPDARTGLRAVAALRRLVRTVEALQVANARARGWSWQWIADTLEDKQRSVRRRHAGRPAVRGSGEGRCSSG